MCRSRAKGNSQSYSAALGDEKSQLANLSSTSKDENEKVDVYILINGNVANCLLDTGAKNNHINKNFCRRLKINVCDSDCTSVGLAVQGASVETRGSCSANVSLQGRKYKDVSFLVMDGLLWDVILGREFLGQHEKVSFMFGGPQSSLQIGALKPLKLVKPVQLFEHLNSNCKPIAVKRRNYSKADRMLYQVKFHNYSKTT